MDNLTRKKCTFSKINVQHIFCNFLNDVQTCTNTSFDDFYTRPFVKNIFNSMVYL